MSFALDLSRRLTSHEVFSESFGRTERIGALSAIAADLERAAERPSDDDLRKLLYCAGVFVQTDDVGYHRMAQSIALNVLLINDDDDLRDRSRRILTDLGNFPALALVAGKELEGGHSFMDALGRTLSRELNSVRVGDDWVPLTDFQKGAWDKLPDALAIAVSAPTSAGKSFLVIEHLCRLAETSSTFCAVYVVPTRALLSEVSSKIQRRLSESSDIRISTVPTMDGASSARQVFVLTQERLQALLAISSVTFDLVIVDEAQNLSAGSRGMILQESVEQAVGRSPGTRLILLAPGARGFEAIGGTIGVPNLAVARSELPSVLQNRIQVKKAEDANALALHLLTERGPQVLGMLRSERGFDLPESRLAAAALELGATGGSLVYATGPTDAEKVARQIANGRPDVGDETLGAVADFVVQHIHPKYSLAWMIRRGVAFHYGKMPTLLRETIEGAFRSGQLRFLACTTTLFEGINLPARNVFIDTPTRGSGTALDAASLWNFAGRAGRMFADIVGNVFLVDYDEWTEKPLDAFVAYEVNSAFVQAASDVPNKLIDALEGRMPPEGPRGDEARTVRAAAGLLISKAANKSARQYVDRTLRTLDENLRTRLADASGTASERIGLPASLLATNWTVDPFGLRRLYDKMQAKVAAGETLELLPVNPHSKEASKCYGAIFTRIQREVNGRPRTYDAYAALVAGVAVDWMRGLPYPALLAKAVRRRERQIEKKIASNRRDRELDPRSRVRDPVLDVDDVIRKEFDLIEEQIRFQYVQLGKAYVDILVMVLKDTGQENRIEDIYEFPMALELGVATRSGWSFMELGLSRIAGAALQPEFPDSNLSVAAARRWLAELPDISSLRLSPVIVDELRRLRLIRVPD